MQLGSPIMNPKLFSKTVNFFRFIFQRFKLRLHLVESAQGASQISPFSTKDAVLCIY